MSADTPIIVVVEDHKDTRDIYALALAHQGFEVRATDDAAEALRVVLTENVALVTIDIGRDRAGFRLASALRDQQNPPRLVALTGHAPAGDPHEAFFDAYLVKPVLPEDLVVAVVRVLARRQ